MDPVAFNALVDRLSAIARDQPAVLRRRVHLLVALGYAYVLGVLLLILGGIVGLVVMIFVLERGAALAKLIFVLAVFAYVIIRALWVKFPPPEGEVIDPSQVPKLAQRVEAIRRALKAPKADTILLTDDYNASVASVPRFGIFGGERRYLMLGLPLLYTMGPRELDAVLAHEFGHLSGSHPKVGLRVGRVSETWGRLLGHFEATENWGRFIFRRFFRWYVPQLNAHAFAMRRDDEFAADADAARISGARAIAQSLATMSAVAPLVTKYWSTLAERVELEPEPPTDAWSRLPVMLAEHAEDASRAANLRTELARRALVDDSHPSLSQRLTALKALPPADADDAGLLAKLVPTPDVTAAEHYLGAIAPRALKEWDRLWLERNAEAWRGRHAAVKVTRERVAELRTRETSLDAKEAWELASALVDLDGDQSAIPALERAIALDPKHAGAHFLLGRALLARRDAAGIAPMQRAMQLDVQAMPMGTALLRDYHAAIGDSEGAVRAESHAHVREEEYTKVVRERNEITKKDVLVPAVLSVKDRAQLSAAARIKGVKAIWVARKKVQQETGDMLLVILVEPRSKFFSSWGSKRLQLTQAVAESLSFEGRIEPLFIPWVDGIDWLVTKIKKANGSRVTARRGIKTIRPQSWMRRHWRPLALAGGGAAIVAAVLWSMITPDRVDDPRRLLTAEEENLWNNHLRALKVESDVDMEVLVDSFAPGTELALLALTEGRARGVGRDSDRRAAFLIVDATSGGVWLEVAPVLVRHFPDDFVGHLVRAHARGLPRRETLAHAIVGTIMVIHHRAREATLGMAFAAHVASANGDSTRIPATAGATFAFASGAPLEVERAADLELEAALASGATPEEALERYRLWLSLPVYVPKAHFLTPSSRQFYQHEFKMTPLFWEHLRHLYIGTTMRVETRGDLAVAYATENPLVTPLFFRRGKDGWQMDTMAELLNSRNIVGGGYSWMLARSGDAFDIAFADRMLMVDGIWRFAGGANQRYVSRGTD